MAVKMRLTRMGDKKNPMYRVIVADSRAPRDGKFVDIVGTYHPQDHENEVKLDVEMAKTWIANGAQPTDTVRGLLVKAGVLEAKPMPAKTNAKKKKSE